MNIEDRYKIFRNIVDSVLLGITLQDAYAATPHKYAGELLFQVECHTIQLIGKGVTTVTAIANAMYKTPSAASQIIRKLRKKGYITQARNPQNNREQIIQLTERGMELYQSHEDYDEKEYHAIFEGYFHDVSAEELEIYLKLQKRFNDAWL